MSGNAIKNAKPIKKQEYKTLLTTLNSILPIGLEIHPYGSAGKKEISGDADFFIDADDILSLFPSKTLSSSRKLLQNYFIDKHYESTRTGNSVHIGIPINGDIIQVDLTTVENAGNIAYLHDHVYDNSEVKGKTIVSIWCDLANLTSNNLMISPYKGLAERDTKRIISNDPYIIAKIIIGPDATEYDMRSPSRLLNAVSYNNIKFQHVKNTYNI